MAPCLIYKHRKEYALHNTEFPYSHQVSLNSTKLTPKPWIPLDQSNSVRRILFPAMLFAVDAHLYFIEEAPDRKPNSKKQKRRRKYSGFNALHVIS